MLQRLRAIRDLALANAGAGWYTSVMGTGILAICMTIAPVTTPFEPFLSRALWSAAVGIFAIVTALWLASSARNPLAVVATLRDPVKAQLWGAPPMACFTLAVGFLRIGSHVLPETSCVAAAQAFFVAGVAGSVFSASVVPFLMFTHHELTPEKAVGSWLLPVVPPIVASVPAALLSPTWPAAIRGDMLALAYGLLGLGTALAGIIVVIFYSRLLYAKVPAGSLVTTTWLVVGPLGQSIAGAIALGTAAKDVWPAYGQGLATVALAYGVLVWGFAMYWLGMAIALTLRALRARLPFDLSWWAFTFPVGVLTAGTDALFERTHAHVFEFASVALLALLAATWSIVARNTVRHLQQAISGTVALIRERPLEGVPKAA